MTIKTNNLNNENSLSKEKVNDIKNSKQGKPFSKPTKEIIENFERFCFLGDINSINKYIKYGFPIEKHASRVFKKAIRSLDEAVIKIVLENMPILKIEDIIFFEKEKNKISSIKGKMHFKNLEFLIEEKINKMQG